MILPLKKGRPRSLSGHDLVGDRLVRFVYLDEAGTSANEPVIVVAGIVVNGDLQWVNVQRRLDSMIENYVPVDKRDGFVFHAKDLANGHGVFDRKTWPLHERMKILKELLAIPGQYGVPIVYGYTRRRVDSRIPAKDALISHHVTAFSQCIVGAERFMRECARPDEIAILVAEDSETARNALRRIHKGMKGDPRYLEARRKIGKAEYLPLQRIVDTVHFAKKAEATLLQLADVCAYAIRRAIAGLPRGDELHAVMSHGAGLPDVVSQSTAGYQIYFRPVVDKSPFGNAWLWRGNRGDPGF